MQFADVIVLYNVMKPEDYFKKGLDKFKKVGKMKVLPVWFDSMGAKSMATFIETPEIKVIIDPGFAVMQPSYPLGDREKNTFLKVARERVKKYTEKADIVIISHFHYDHHKRPVEFPEAYIGKTLYMKNPNEWINYSQWKRTRILYEDLVSLLGGGLKINDLKEEPEKRKYKDPYLDLNLVKEKDFGDYTDRHEELLEKWRANMYKNLTGWGKEEWLAEFTVGETNVNFIRKGSIEFDKTEIYFPGTLFHGIEYARTGWVEPVIIKRNDAKVLFTSDIMGPNIEDYAQWIIEENADVIILDGPSTYLLGYLMNQINLNRCIENVSRILRESDFELMIYDHHLIREKNFREHMGNFYDLVKKTGKKVLTAAEWFDLPPLVDII